MNSFAHALHSIKLLILDDGTHSDQMRPICLSSIIQLLSVCVAGKTDRCAVCIQSLDDHIFKRTVFQAIRCFHRPYRFGFYVERYSLRSLTHTHTNTNTHKNRQTNTDKYSNRKTHTVKKKERSRKSKKESNEKQQQQRRIELR